MAYVDPNYKTKAAFRKAVESGVKHHPYVPGGMFDAPKNGRISIEGPHYPEAHRWYASCEVTDGVITKVR